MTLKPQNLAILAGLGLAAYFLTMRSARAGSVASKTPGVWNQSPTRAIMPAGQDTAMAAGINLIGKLFGSSSEPIYRSPDFNPGYYPDNAGEGAARAYYVANPDAFAVNPPTSFNSDPQLYASTGGWADQQ